jgi:hypothetical protein
VGKERKKTRIVPVSKPITQIHPTECNCPRLLQIFLNPQKLQQQQHHLICLSVSDQSNQLEAGTEVLLPQEGVLESEKRGKTMYLWGLHFWR